MNTGDASTIDVAAVAQLLGVSPRTVYRWAAHHGLPSHHTDDGLRFDPDAVRSWEREQRPTRRTTPAATGDVAAHVLDAAVDVIASEGIDALTVERVARRAGMSVGGVTYHFTSKQTLVEALATRFLDAVEAQWTAAHTDGRSLADAYVAVSLADDDDLRGARAILTAVAADAATLERIDRTIRSWYRRIERASDRPDDDLRRCLAADAVWLFRVLGVRPISRRRATQCVGGPSR